MPKAAPLTHNQPPYLTNGCLVIASPDSISEASFSVPAVRAIRLARPEITIAVVTNHTTAPLWRKVAGIDYVLEHSPGSSARKIEKLLKHSKIPFDSAIAWEGGATAQAFASYPIEQRLGYPSNDLSKFLTDPVKIIRDPGPIEHRVRHYLLFVEKIGADPFQPSNFVPPPRPPAPTKPILAIAPGSDFGTAAEWPIERFIEFSKKIPSQFEIAILPSPDRPGPATALASALDLPVTDLHGDDLVDFIATCQGLVANDGSLPHFAALVGTPSIVLFGPNEPQWRRPLGRSHKIIRHNVPCSACLLNKCPLDHRCMIEITVDRLVEDLHAFLK